MPVWIGESSRRWIKIVGLLWAHWPGNQAYREEITQSEGYVIGRKAIKDSGRTVNAIAVEAGIPQPVLHRFAKGDAI